MANIVPEVPVVKIPEIQPLSLEAHQEAALAIGDEAAPSGVLGIVTRGLENHEAPREILEDVVIPPTEASTTHPQENPSQPAAATPEGVQPAANVVAEGGAAAPATQQTETTPQPQQEAPPADHQPEQTQEQKLNQELADRRDRVKKELVNLSKELIQGDDFLGVLAAQAIAAEDTPLGDHYREVILQHVYQIHASQTQEIDQLSPAFELIKGSPLANKDFKNTPFGRYLTASGRMKEFTKKSRKGKISSLADAFEVMFPGGKNDKNSAALWGRDAQTQEPISPNNPELLCDAVGVTGEDRVIFSQHIKEATKENRIQEAKEKINAMFGRLKDPMTLMIAGMVLSYGLQMFQQPDQKSRES